MYTCPPGVQCSNKGEGILNWELFRYQEYEHFFAEDWILWWSCMPFNFVSRENYFNLIKEWTASWCVIYRKIHNFKLWHHKCIITFPWFLFIYLFFNNATFLYHFPFCKLRAQSRSGIFTYASYQQTSLSMSILHEKYTGVKHYLRQTGNVTVTKHLSR